MKKRKISTLLAVITMASSLPMSVLAKDIGDYADVHEGDWFYRCVRDVSERELMTGMNETTFAPTENLARGQLATVIYRMEGCPETSYEAVFSDVADGYFYSVPIVWASQYGVVTGYQDGSGNFGPSDNITREQLATMLYRYANSEGYDVTASDGIGSFPDGYAVSGYAVDGINWCISREIITGDQGNINPQGTVNRAVAATMLSRFCEKIVQAPKTPDAETNSGVNADENSSNTDTNNPAVGSDSSSAKATTTIHHEAEGYFKEPEWIETKPAWTETQYVSHRVCSNCGYDTTDSGAMSNHIFENFENGCTNNSTYDEEVSIPHAAEGYWTEREWVETKPAWDEVVPVSEGN